MWSQHVIKTSYYGGNVIKLVLVLYAEKYLISQNYNQVSLLYLINIIKYMSCTKSTALYIFVKTGNNNFRPTLFYGNAWGLKIDKNNEMNSHTLILIVLSKINFILIINCASSIVAKITWLMVIWKHLTNAITKIKQMDSFTLNHYYTLSLPQQQIIITGAQIK